MKRHLVESDEDTEPENISDTTDQLIWNGDLDNPNDSKKNCAVDRESDIEHDNSIEDLQCPERWDVSTTPNVPWLILPTRKSNRQGKKLFATVTGMEMCRNKAVKQK